ncbi:MAG: bifunctional molybdenum cofactor biosynthesis protein MoaC/MoaB [Cyclobacteriaceae bacterium]|nr:bifunctional molybdenum cofactor biosynthesis protein MoaC/MoaB [Cyclobacteriaceae bacterium HetDA_MAG_MS6]
MVDITHKTTTLREATAQAIVKVSSQNTIDLIEKRQIPKGDVFEMSKAAGLLAVKKTPDLLPDCHPIPIEATSIKFEIQDQQILILVSVKTIYKTGVEVEAMHGASVVALTIYDMLKPVDKGVEICNLRLLEKKGGKSSFKSAPLSYGALVVVCSDTVSMGKSTDKSGKVAVDRLEGMGLTVDYQVIADDRQLIKSIIENNAHDLILFCGGTGVGPRDVTSDVLRSMLDMELPGISETIRHYGQERMRHAMLSRSIAGIRNGQLLLAVPGSVGGVTEAIDAVFPQVFHVFEVLKGSRHDS